MNRSMLLAHHWWLRVSPSVSQGGPEALDYTPGVPPAYVLGCYQEGPGVNQRNLDDGINLITNGSMTQMFCVNYCVQAVSCKPVLPFLTEELSYKRPKLSTRDENDLAFIFTYRFKANLQKKYHGTKTIGPMQIIIFFNNYLRSFCTINPSQVKLSWLRNF